MDEESSMIQAISTHKGVYKVKRLMFGVKTAPSAWQRFMDKLMQDLDGVVCFFDDIAVQGATMEELYHRLRAVMQRLTSKLYPLYQLLKTNVKFIWSKQCENVFVDLKKTLTSTEVLTPFDPELPLTLATDASPTGLGAVISHTMSDGSERPIAYASRSLKKAEQNYSQLEREATAIVWGMRKFFHYCYGRRFTLITDNQPLVRIFHPQKDLPATSAIRLIHYANYISGFNYEIKYRNTKAHANVDYLSRMPVSKSSFLNHDSHELFQINEIEQLPITKNEIRRRTLRDPLLKKIYIAIETDGEMPKGFPREEFTIQDGCLLRGIRVAIPEEFRQQILEELHQSHAGIVRMKSLARSYVWWPVVNNPTKSIVHPWDYATKPWQRLHIDYAGPFHGTYLFILVDSYSKWLEVIPTKSITSSITINILREIFSRFGLPYTIVSDNGTNFTSHEFKNFLKSNGINHKLTAPYHPATNGQAERYVQTVKNSLRAQIGEGDLLLNLCRFLMQYRKTPNATTGISPAEMLLNRKIRTTIDLIRRYVGTEINERNLMPTGDRKNILEIGTKVQARNYTHPTDKWNFGTIVGRSGTQHYDIEIQGKIQRRHRDQLLPYAGKIINQERQLPKEEITRNIQQENPEVTKEVPKIETPFKLPQERKETPEKTTIVPSKMTITPIPELRRSERIRKAPSRLNL
nr:uncharacterized protein K02A2.6-like [Onthophagus taurus]